MNKLNQYPSWDWNAIATAVEAMKNNAIKYQGKEAITEVTAVSSRSEKVGEYILKAMEKL